MARYDVFKGPGSSGYLLDCQADVLGSLNTRFVVPLLRAEQGPLPIARLNPELRVADETFIMYTQFAASVPARDLKRRVASLAGDDRTIMNALDMLLTGY